MTAQFHESPAHVPGNFQSLVRFGVKLELLAGLAHEARRGRARRGRRRLRRPRSAATSPRYCATFDALVKAAERFPLVSEGYARPHPQYVYAGMSLQRRLIVDLYRTVRELAGGAFQTCRHRRRASSRPTPVPTPSATTSPAPPRRDRVKLIKLDLGLDRHRVRRASAPVRDVLLRRPAGGEPPDVPLLRLGVRQGHGRPPALGILERGRRAHLLRWRPRQPAQRTESTPRRLPSGAASQLDPSPRSSPVLRQAARAFSPTDASVMAK